MANLTSSDSNNKSNGTTDKSNEAVNGKTGLTPVIGLEDAFAGRFRLRAVATHKIAVAIHLPPASPVSSDNLSGNGEFGKEVGMIWALHPDFPHFEVYDEPDNESRNSSLCYSQSGMMQRLMEKYYPGSDTKEPAETRLD